MEHTAHEQPKHAAHDAPLHDSNPFTTAVTGMKKLFTLNANALTGFLFFSAAFGLVLVATIIAIAITLLAFALQHGFTWTNSMTVMLPDLLQVSNAIGTISSASIYATWVIGGALVIVFGLMVHLVALKLALASTAEQPVGFGEVFRQSFKRLPAALGLVGIVVVVTIVASVILSVLVQLLGPIGYVLALIAIFCAIYIVLRLLFTWLSLVNGSGPVAALEDSWAMTTGHLAETVGIFAAGSTIVVLPFIVLDLLIAVTGGAVAGVLSLIALLAGLVSVVVTAAAMAERFWQLRAIAVGKLRAAPTHPYNYLAVLALIIVVCISGAISRQSDQTTLPVQPQCAIYGLQSSSSVQCTPIQPSPFSGQ